MKSALLAILALALLGALGFLLFLDPSGAAPLAGGRAGSDGGGAAAALAGGNAAGAAEPAAPGEIGRTGAGEASAARPTARLAFDGPAAVVTARLVDAAGAAARGAAAEIHRSGELAGAWMPAPPESAEESEWPAIPAGADGVVRVEVPAGLGLSVDFGGERWRTQTRALQALREGETADFGEIALTRATRLAGTVYGAAGAPLAGAKVQLRSADAGEFWEGFTLQQEVVTGADGVAVFAGVPRGRVRIEADAPRHAPGLIEALEVAGDGADQGFELRLESGGSLVGRVVDADRRPIAGAQIYLVRLDENDFYWGDWLPAFPDREPDAVSGEDGGFRVGGLPALAPGARSRSLLLARADEVGTGSAREVAAGGEVTITIPRGVRASGRVVATDGAPLAATVLLEQETPWGYAEQKAETASAADGSFTLPRVPPGAYTLRAHCEIGLATPLPLDLQRDVEDFLLRIERDPLLTVLVLDPAGAPVADARVEAHTPGRSGPGQVMITGFMDASEPSFGESWSATADSDESGRARFRDPAAGELELSVAAAGWARTNVRIQSTGADQEAEVRLQRPGSLTVLVHDAAGAPVHGVAIRLRDDERGTDASTETTDALGRVAWSDLAPGEWTVRHSAGGDDEADFFDLEDFGAAGAPETPAAEPAGAKVRIAAGEHAEHRIRLEDLAILTVRVTRGGAPAPDVAVRLEKYFEDAESHLSIWNDGDARGSRTDARGMVALVPVSAGDYRLIAKSARNAPDTVVELTLHAGPQRRDIAMLGAEVRGALRGPSGPLIGARVSLEAFAPGEEGEESGFGYGMIATMDGVVMDFGHGKAAATVSTGAGGDYVFQDVPPGQWVVKAKHKGVGPWTSLPLTVSGSGSVRVPDQTLLPGAVLHGHDANWSGPRDGQDRFDFDWESTVRIENAAGRTVGMAQLDERGDWRLEDLAEDSYVVIRGEWRSEPIHLSPGEVQRVDVPRAPPKQEEF